jgi:hypothetical protein
MAGVKGKSGPPGNMNSVVRTWEVFWRRRALKPGDRWLMGTLGSYLDGLLQSDKPNASESEKRMAEIAMTARGCTMLILQEAKKRGLLRISADGTTWDLQPGMKELAKFLTIERACLSSLGMQRDEKLVLPIEPSGFGSDSDSEQQPHSFSFSGE